VYSHTHTHTHKRRGIPGSYVCSFPLLLSYTYIYILVLGRWEKEGKGGEGGREKECP
jgi:hypothetical protein